MSLLQVYLFVPMEKDATKVFLVKVVVGLLARHAWEVVLGGKRTGGDIAAIQPQRITFVF